ncbi:ornithine carbamoyltransferase [Marinibaculum pumilum]|uniref:Ornithine carbamoyltransferase n=1 Tax=Marinibaculum pumilum TaxID=1766165 RepID=A0ABV7L773_9PROT
MTLHRTAARPGAGPRHFLDLAMTEAAILRALVDDALTDKKLRAGRPRGRIDEDAPLYGQVLALLFEKPSTRTRVSFDIAMRQLGGETLVLQGTELQLKRGESWADTARVLSRYVDVVMMRTAAPENLEVFAAHAGVPVINGLTNDSHPCQIIADLMTFEEARGPIRGRTIAWCGDGNNVSHSWIHAAAKFGFVLRMACPSDLRPSRRWLDWADDQGADVLLTDDPRAAVEGADCVVTDCWVSMGDTAGERHRLLQPFQVNEALMAHAAKDALFMHCLPAHRGEEVTDAVIDGPQSVVFDEAENRVHAQKAILKWCLEAI